MISRPLSITKYAGRYGLSVVFLAGLMMLLPAGPELLAQDNASSTGGPSDLKIEVLEVTTGSGSKPQVQDKPPLQIEVMDMTTGSGSKAANTVDQAPSRPAPPPVQNNTQKPAPATTADAKAEAKEGQSDTQREALLAALDRWHYETLASYNYNIAALVDPFMPIQEVRGQPEVKIDPEDWAKRSPIERLELNQLKLVAITALTERQGGAWASFEDGANNSYILSVGSKIGRNHGRITKIAPNEVWVEERGRSGQEAPKTTVIRMNALDTQGLTRDGGGDSGGFQTLSVPQ